MELIDSKLPKWVENLLIVIENILRLGHKRIQPKIYFASNNVELNKIK